MITGSHLALSDIRHRRFAPKPHAFDYKIAYLLVDCDTIEKECANVRFISTNKKNMVSLSAQDYLSGNAESFKELKAEAIEKVRAHTSVKENINRVLLLTLPRFFSYLMNPVSFYFLFSADNADKPAYIISEITNTPWGEKHCYVHVCEEDKHAFDFKKNFHVSPFMPMHLDYSWRFNFSKSDGQTKIKIFMNLLDQQEKVFDAYMDVAVKPWKKKNAYPFLFPVQSMVVGWGIYWQALKIKLKGNPFFVHPKKKHTQLNG